ncbi:Anoctamin-9 [Plecturocebus cupreus]
MPARQNPASPTPSLAPPPPTASPLAERALTTAACRNYFREKVALYFSWLGWYTYMLVPAALTGLVVFLSGFSLFKASQISKEICEANNILVSSQRPQPQVPAALRDLHFHQAHPPL